MTPEAAYPEVERLVKKFKSLSAAERRNYNEAATRQGFILPLFHALGWDTANPAEVSPEEKVSRGWVDFSFRLSNIPRFFLETKKITEDLNDPRWVKQAIDYAWTKSVTWAVLSDFEGMRVFNAEWKEDDPFRAEFLSFSVDSYLTDFERLWWLSRPETAVGRLDREAEKVGKKIRREPVSQRLFDDLKEWRHDLFRHLRAYNKMFSPAQIDEAVLRILNRLIFVRAAEDREVESRRLLPLVRELADQRRLNDLPRELAKLFREFDSTYNSELFARHFSEGLDCEPAPYQRLIEDLYEKRFVRYNFNAIDADVLGTAYEQYLGHVITDPEAAEVVEKRQKRKSQGIFYTPTFVVKYIVAQTLGRRLEESGYDPSRPVRVLDMACGSGSFLIEAFDTLDRFVARQRGQAYGAREDIHDYARRMEILTGCIYGVDKDKQAAEVARLNLLLRALHWRDRLPMLANIREGDSLISGAPDELQAAFGKEWKEKRAFNWDKEFADATRDGGFDVIVGNPPYVRIQTLPKDEVAFFNERYSAATGNYDIYVLFVERALQMLKPGGVMGFILPNKFMQVDYGVGLRKLLSENNFVESIVDFREFQVFEGATTYTCLLFLKKRVNPKVTVLSIRNKDGKPTDDIFNVPSRELAPQILTEKAWALADDASKALIEKLNSEQAIRLLELPSEISRGSSTGADEVFILTPAGGGNYKTRDGRVVQVEPEILRTPLYATGFGRYQFRTESRERILFPYDVDRHGYSLKGERDFKKEFPKAYKYLSGQREKLESRKDFQQWYAFSAPRSLNVHDTAQLIVPLLANHGLYTELPKNKSKYCLMASGGFSISISKSDLSLRYILGVLNSTLLFWHLRQISNVFRGGWITCTKQYVGQLPIRHINFDDKADKKRHDAIVKLVEEMLELQKEHAEAERALDDRRHALKRRIDEIDREIDRRVYDLYGLTTEEIAIVENGRQA